MQKDLRYLWHWQFICNSLEFSTDWRSEVDKPSGFCFVATNPDTKLAVSEIIQAYLYHFCGCIIGFEGNM